MLKLNRQPLLGRSCRIADGVSQRTFTGGFQFHLDNLSLGNIYYPPEPGYYPVKVGNYWFWTKGDKDA